MCIFKAIHTLHIALFNRDYIFIQFKNKTWNLFIHGPPTWRSYKNSFRNVCAFQDRIGIWKCWFLRRGENRSTLRKTSRTSVENQQQTQPTYDARSRNRTRDTLVGSERSHHCTNPAPSISWVFVLFGIIFQQVRAPKHRSSRVICTLRIFSGFLCLSRFWFTYCWWSLHLQRLHDERTCQHSRMGDLRTCQVIRCGTYYSQWQLYRLFTHKVSAAILVPQNNLVRAFLIKHFPLFAWLPAA